MIQLLFIKVGARSAPTPLSYGDWVNTLSNPWERGVGKRPPVAGSVPTRIYRNSLPPDRPAPTVAVADPPSSALSPSSA